MTQPEVPRGDDEDDLIAARMVNELVYCPRLYWLETVAAAFDDNRHTVLGQHAHRRVDQPGGTAAKAEDGGTDVLERGTWLASGGLGVSAKFDRVVKDPEHEGALLPVDTKKGRLPTGGGLWPADEVQLVLQGMLLREAGHRVERVAVYSVAEQRRVAIPRIGGMSCFFGPSSAHTPRMGCSGGSGGRPATDSQERPMKSLIVGSLFTAVLAAPAVLACDGHNGQTAATTTVVASNGDKAAPAQKSETVTPAAAPAAAAPAAAAPAVAAVPAAAAAKEPFKLVGVDDVANKLEAQKKDKKVAIAIFDANGKETRQSQGIIPTAVLLPSASEYDLAVLPKDKATPVVFYCANEKCTASHTAAKRAAQSGYSDVARTGY